MSWLIASLLTVALSVTSLGNFGETYKISEKDAMQEIMDKAASIDKQKLRSEMQRKLKDYRPSDSVTLTPASKSYSYTVDMTYTLEYDIPRVNQDGKVIGVLYPKGYTFNPLDYMVADPPTMVIFNGDSQKELKWVAYYYKTKPVVLAMTQGDWQKVSKDFGRQIYYLKKKMAEKLRLKNTVAVVYKEGRLMKVDVYAVK